MESSLHSGEERSLPGCKDIDFEAKIAKRTDGRKLNSEKVMTFWENVGFLVFLRHGRQNDSRTTAPLHGKHQEPEYKAGGDCAEIPFRSRIPFPHQCEEVARYSRYCIEEVSYLHLRERMLLARS